MSVVANVAINVDATKALGQLKAVDQASKGLDDGLKGAAVGAKGLGAAISAALGPLLAFSTAVATVQKGLTTAFERGAAEQRLKNLTSSTGEYRAALAAASTAADRFGMTQTDATQAFADAYGRLNSLGYGLKEVNQVYVGFNNAAMQAGVSSEDAAGAFLQLSQGMGAGVLNGENLATILERMPQFGALLASSMGVSAGQIKQLGAEGKITGDVIYKALSQSAQASGDFSNKLTEQQKAFNALGQASDKLLNAIGELFAPVTIAGAKALAQAADEIGTFFEYLASKIFPETEKKVEDLSKVTKEVTDETIKFGQVMKVALQITAGVGTFVGVIKAVAIGIAVWSKATLLLATAKKALGAAMAFVLGLTGKGLVVVAAAAAAATIAANQVGKEIDAIGADIDDFNAKQKASEQAAAGTVSQYSSMPAKIQTAAEANSKLIESTNQVLTNLKDQSSAIDAQIASLGRGASINSARYEAEKSINDLQGQQLERQYGLAKTAQQRLDIAIAIFNQQVKAAEIEYKQALENIQLEQRKQELQIQSAQLKYKEIEAEGQLQILKAGSAEEEAKKRAQLSEALATQNQVVQETRNQGSAQQQIAEYQKQTAAAQYESKVLAAQTALEQKLTSDQIGMSAEGATRLSGSLAQSASNAGQLAGTMNQVANQANAAANAIQRVNAARAANTVTAAPGRDISGRSIQDAIQRSGGVRGGGYAVTSSSRQTSASGQLTGIDRSYINADGTRGSARIKAHFATGGYVTKPTDAMVGEGGEPEYIIPASKMQEAMKRYAEGKRGNSVIPSTVSPQVNVTTGPVMSMNGQNYVSQRDLVSGLMSASRSTAESVIDMLRSDMSVRREIGLS